jgi:hypothetical protein
MGKTKYSYAETVLNIVNEFGDILKKNYPFVAQLSLAPNIEGAKVLTLNNKKEAQGDIATFYYKDIRNLADPTIRKVNNENDNQRISEVFEAFSLMMFYQHGVGNTSLGFTKVLDPAKFKELIKTDSANFIGNYLDETTLDKIANIVLNNQRFKNYTVQPQDIDVEEIEYEEEVDLDAEGIELVKGDQVVFNDDIQLFKNYLSKANGKKPQKFFTPNTTFGAFYNTSTGKREGMPQSAVWELQANGLYDMIDQDPDSGEVYYENVDLTNGIQMVDPKAPKAEQPVKPSEVSNEFAIADTLTPIEQNFKDGQGGRQMQDQFKGKSTMDLIISGDRTRTTRAKTDIQRMAKDYGLSKISDLVGKVIRMTDKTGKEVYTRITKVAPFTQEYQDATWQKEGWKKEVTDKNVGNYPYAIEFEVVTPESTQNSAINFQENQTGGYPARTKINASADATIHLAINFETPGEKLTKKSVNEQSKTYIALNASSLEVTPERINKLVDILNSNNVKTLNIAGNGIYDMKQYTQEQVDNFTYQLLEGALNSPNLKTKIISIRSGGQTGFDEAGAKAGIKLGIPTTVLAPKDWEFRTNTGNVKNEEAFKARFKTTTQPAGEENLSDLQQIARYREAEQADLLAAIPNIAEYPDTYAEKQGNMPDDLYAIYKPIYDKYDALISPLLKPKEVKERIQTISEDIAVFNDLVKANKGVLPKTFMVADRKWILNGNGNYDLVDSATGDIFMKNISMETGLAEPEASQVEPLNEAVKTAGLEYLLSMQDELAEPLADLGYDIKDLMNNLAKAKTVEDYNKIQEILNKLC